MRKLAIAMFILLIIATVLITLGVTNYAGIGDWMYNNAEGSMMMPMRNWAVDNWLAVGNMGFAYIAAVGLGISIVGGLFLVFIVYGLFWKKAVQNKLLHKTSSTSSIGNITMRREPAEPEQAPTPKTEKTPQTEE